jgi:phospholipid transport system substrate-binding protein
MRRALYPAATFRSNASVNGGAYITVSGTEPMKTTLFALTLLSTATFAAPPKDEVTKPLKVVINSVRYGKDLLALKSFAGEEQGKQLMGESWDKGTDAQRKEFVALFHQLFAKIAFPKIRKNFENLDTVLYDDPALAGDRADIGSTILIKHPLKNQELKVKYNLLKGKAGWQVIDVAVLGDSMLKGIREDQIQPLFKEGGWDGVLKAMKDKNAELKDVVLK